MLPAGFSCSTERSTIADFTAFSLYISLFISPIERLVGFIEQYQNGMTGFRRFIEIMDCKPESDKPGASLLENVKGDVSFENVSFSYPDGKKVLDGLSFDIEAGKTLALVGPSGGGKRPSATLSPDSMRSAEEGSPSTVTTRGMSRLNR